MGSSGRAEVDFFREDASQDSQEDRMACLDDSCTTAVEDDQQSRQRRQKGWRGLPSKVKKHLVKNGIDSLFWTAIIKEEDAPVDLKERVRYAFRRREELTARGQACGNIDTSYKIEADCDPSQHACCFHVTVQCPSVDSASYKFEQ